MFLRMTRVGAVRTPKSSFITAAMAVAAATTSDLYIPYHMAPIVFFPWTVVPALDATVTPFTPVFFTGIWASFFRFPSKRRTFFLRHSKKTEV